MVIGQLLGTGWQVFATANDPLCDDPVITEAVAAFDCQVVRDVVISSRPGVGDLAAQEGEFWFHTDGSFVDRPPRLICIQVLETEGGGDLWILDRERVLETWPAGEGTPRDPISFGRGGAGTVAPVWSPEPAPGIFRFRQDYMQEGPPGLVARAAEAVELAAARAAPVGQLAPGNALLLDNWRVLHRRQDFFGVRTIRRLWLDSQP